MTIRWKLNASIFALTTVFLVASGFSLWAVRRNAEETQAYLRMRDSSQFTADLRTQLYQQLAITGGAMHPVRPGSHEEWLEFTLEHIEVQMRLARSDGERRLWSQVGVTFAALGDALGSGGGAALDGLVQQGERDLQELRSYYDLAQSRSIADTAGTSLRAQVAVGVACVLTLLLFLASLAMVRRWLVRPVEVLKHSADVIGRGRLEHRVPLAGTDELAQLARSVDAMAANLAAHQAALLQARELSTLGELCANVAHGLRNPLAALRASIQLAGKRESLGTSGSDLLCELASQVDRMDERITRLFRFSRPIEVRPQRTTFEELALAAQAQVLPLLSSRGVKLQVSDRTSGAAFAVDSDKLAEALAEILSNAAYHSPDGAAIELAGEVAPPNNGDGPILRLTVQDHGTGMPQATREKAFDLFFTGRPGGTGMGLTLVRRFVERSGGAIELESSPGAGTTVRISVPVTAHSQEPAHDGSAGRSVPL